MVTYPQDVAQVGVFYNESERLVRFLTRADKHGFSVFLDAMSKGNRFETALNKGFAAKYISLDALDREFKTYATPAKWFLQRRFLQRRLNRPATLPRVILSGV